MPHQPTRRQFLGAVAAAAAFGQASRRRPNILFFLADDLGIGDLGSYGSRFHETPHLDRLAAQGMRFTQAYAACPVCSPTRISIMTGKYPARTGITNYLPGNQSFPRAPMKAVTNRLEMDPDEVTLAEALRSAGYATGIVGKWHLGDTVSAPERQGFDFSAHRGVEKDGRFLGTDTLEGSPEDFITDRFARTAARFVREHKADPFFLYVPFNDPHIPLKAKPEYIAKYEAKRKRMNLKAGDALNPWPGAAQGHPIYAAMIQSMDEAVGTVLGEVDRCGLTRDTLVVFFSDNGGLTVPEWNCQIPTSNAPFRAGKGHLYEGGIRDPLIVRWPGVVRAGSRCDAPVLSTDFFSTLTEASGVSANPQDGISMMPLLRGSGRPRRDALYWHYPHYANQLGVPAGAIRQGDWKLIEFFEDGHLELYNLAKDPGERQDLARKLPDRAGELHAKLKAWRAEVGAQMPALNPNHDPAQPWEGLNWYSRCRGSTGSR